MNEVFGRLTIVAIEETIVTIRLLIGYSVDSVETPSIVLVA
jgi:hypothetical protein